MSDHHTMRISAAAMLACASGAALAVAAAGVYPTYRLAGGPGLTAQLVAAAVAMLVMGANAFVVGRLCPATAGRLTTIFLLSSTARIAACLVLTGAAWLITAVPLGALSLWVAVFYIAMLISEGLWLGRAIARQAHLDALREARPARPAAGGTTS